MRNYLFGLNEKTQKKFVKLANISGIVFVLLGAYGVIYPQIMSLATVFFIGWLLMIGGFTAGYFTWKVAKNHWLGWLKAFVLMLSGLLIVLEPLPGIAVVSLLLVIYLLFDAFSSAAISFSMKPEKGWWLWLLNAFFSFFLALIFILRWPSDSIWLLGLFVGISLFFDGFALIVMGNAFKHRNK